MNSKIVGIVLVVIGIALAVWGYNIYDSAGAQISQAISGDVPIEAWVGMVGGAICIIFGAAKIK